jgi:UDP-glucose:(heptosyl)LPS alpha-1,3-glucosyltransferase
MDIAIIRRSYQQFGGAERFISRLASSLSNKSIDTHLFTENWQSTDSNFKSIERIKVSGLSRSARAEDFRESVCKILRRRRFSIVQSHERILGADIFRVGDGVHAAYISRVAAASTALKSFIRSKDPYHKEIISLERRMVSETKTHFVANSALVKQDLLTFLDVPDDRISVIRNSVDTDHFTPASVNLKSTSRMNLGVPSDQLVLCFVGSGFERKGLKAVLHSLCQLKDVTLIIAGQDKNLGAFVSLAKSLGISRSVIFVGAKIDIRPVFWASDIFVLPSLYDPYPNAGLEALSCGLPVVCTKTVGLSDVLDGAGVICEFDGSSIASNILSICGKDLLNKYSRQARAIALDHQDDSIMPRWISLYSQYSL